MSRPILSRPRTRVYGCNYDKGESYYKPMVDHLDRKYSGRPLFSEPRNSFADEIAARRSDIGSRNLSGHRNGFDEMDFLCDYNSRSPDYENDDDYLLAQRRIKERAAAAFEEDLAELRRKRRDMQDRLFDSVDINKEIKKAKDTLASAGVVFQRHARKFDNADDYEQELSLAQRMNRRKMVASQEIPNQRKPQQPMWAKLVPADQAVLEPTSPLRQRLNSIIAENIMTDSAQEKEEVMKRRAINARKKSVCF